MGLNPVSDSMLDQNFRYLEKLIKSSQQQGIIVTQQSAGKQNFTFNRSWVGQGLTWLLHRLSVLAKPDEGISVSKAGVATIRKPDYGIDCDSEGLLLLVEADKGLSLSAAGLAVLLEVNKGLTVSAAGLALKQQAVENDAAAVSAISVDAGTNQIDRAAFNTALTTLVSEINGIKTTLNNLLAKLRTAEIIDT